MNEHEHEAISYCRQFVAWLDGLADVPDGIGDTWHAAADMLEEIDQSNKPHKTRLWVRSITADTPEKRAVMDELREKWLK